MTLDIIEEFENPVGRVLIEQSSVSKALYVTCHKHGELSFCNLHLTEHDAHREFERAKHFLTMNHKRTQAA